MRYPIPFSISTVFDFLPKLPYINAKILRIGKSCPVAHSAGICASSTITFALAMTELGKIGAVIADSFSGIGKK
jgi:hypothetical protein